MRRDSLIGLAALAALALGGCDQILGQAEKAAPAPASAGAAPPFDSALLRAHVGQTYSVFVQDSGVQYGPDTLGLAAVDRARLWRAMAESEHAALLSGGGAEALVFKGCADTGCGDGVAIVAIDTANGGVFAAVRDVGGADVLAPNDRVEALLRLNSPTRSWENAAPQPPEAPAQP